MSAPAAKSRIVLTRNVGETLCFATVGGVTLGLLGMPAGWLSGSIIAVAVAALFGRPMFVPVLMMQILLIAIGISLGAVVTPETLHGMATYPFSIAVLIAAMSVVSVVGSAYLRRVHGWDEITAYLSAAPGGLSQVMAVGAELKSDLRAIAIVQTMRVVIVAVGLPAALMVFGFGGHGRQRVGGPFDITQLDELAVLIAASTMMAIVAYRLRFPGGLLFGAMLTSAVLHGTGYVQILMPWWIATTAMVGFGAVVGARFANTPMRLLLDFIGAALGAFTVTVAIAAIFAFGLISVLNLPVAEVMIAYAPGSVDAMMLLALALHMDPVFVGAHHLTRIFFVSLSIPIVARRKARVLATSEGKQEAPDEPRQRPRIRWPFQD